MKKKPKSKQRSIELKPGSSSNRSPGLRRKLLLSALASARRTLKIEKVLRDSSKKKHGLSNKKEKGRMLLSSITPRSGFNSRLTSNDKARASVQLQVALTNLQDPTDHRLVETVLGKIDLKDLKLLKSLDLTDPISPFLKTSNILVDQDQSLPLLANTEALRLTRTPDTAIVDVVEVLGLAAQ